MWDAKKKRTKRRNRSGYRPAAADRLSSDLLRASRSTFGDMIHRHRHQRPQGSEPCIGYDCFAGSGVLGYQIAFQTAFKGFNVVVYDINDEVLEKAKLKFDQLASSYKTDMKATDLQIAATKQRLSYSSDLAKALADADLLIEAIPENPQ